MICRKCGKENENRSVCIQCGNFIGKNVKVIDKDPESIKRRKKKNAILFTKSMLKSVLITLASLFVIGLIIFLLTFWMVRSMDWSGLEELESELSIEQSKVSEDINTKN